MANVALTIPSAAVVGDLLDVHILSFQGDSTATTPTGPGPWTFVRTIQIQNGATDDVYRHTVAAGDRNKVVTWTVTGSLVQAGVMLDIAGSTGEDEYWAAGYASTSVVANDPRFGALAVGELALALYIVAANVALSPPLPWTAIQNVSGPSISFMFAQTPTVTGTVLNALGGIIQPVLSFDISPVSAPALAVTITYLGVSTLRAFATA